MASSQTAINAPAPAVAGAFDSGEVANSGSRNSPAPVTPRAVARVVGHGCDVLRLKHEIHELAVALSRFGASFRSSILFLAISLQHSLGVGKEYVMLARSARAFALKPSTNPADRYLATDTRTAGAVSELKDPLPSRVLAALVSSPSYSRALSSATASWGAHPADTTGIQMAAIAKTSPWLSSMLILPDSSAGGLNSRSVVLMSPL